MTSIQQLQISGIRSFDPSTSNRQTIYFQKPLTVILGKNGAGKTTIIESLLNACAGVMPPGSGQEKSSFVYDPKVIGEGEVKAQIRLIFTAKDGKMIQVIRSFQVTRLRHKVTFATLDNTVAYQDPQTGNVVSSTYKAAQVDRVIPEMLGVSPAVLEHVIFCHQEASNWPLSSPKEVKQIFDEIFSATRYVLALERFREIAKEYRMQLKDQEGNLLALGAHREHAQDIQKSIQRKMDAIGEVQRRASDVAPRLKELQGVLTALDGADQQVEVLARESALLEGKIQEKYAALQRSSLCCAGNTQSIAEVEGLMQQCRHAASSAEQQIQLLRPQTERMASQLLQLEGELRQLGYSIQHLEREEYEHQQHCGALRAQVGAEVAAELFTSDFVLSQQTAQDLVRAAIRAVPETQQVVQSEIKKVEELLKVEEGRRQNILRRMDADSKEREMLEEVLVQLRRRLESTQSELDRLKKTAPATSLAVCKAEVEAAARELKALQSMQFTTTGEREMEQLEDEIICEGARATKLKQLLSHARAFLATAEDTNALQDRLDEKRRAMLSVIKDDVKPQLNALHFKYSVDDIMLRFHEIYGVVEDYHQKQNEDNSFTTGKCKELEHRISVLEEQRMRNVTEAEECRLKHGAVCSGISKTMRVASGEKFVAEFEELVQGAAKEVERLEHEQHKLEAMSVCFSDLLVSATEENACPLCNRPFDKESISLKTFMASNKSREVSATDLKRAEKSVKEKQMLLQKLQSLRPRVNEARQLEFQMHRAQEHARPLAAQVRVEEDQLDAQRSRIAESAARCRGAQQALGVLKSHLPLAQEIDFLSCELSAKKKKKEEYERELRSGAPGDEDISMTTEELMNRLESTLARQRDLENQLNALRDPSEGREGRLKQAEERLADKKRALLRAQEDERRGAELSTTIKQLQEEINTRKAKGQELSQQRPQLQSVLSKTDAAMEALRRQRVTAESEGSKRVLTAQQHASSLDAGVQRGLKFLLADGYSTLRREREMRVRTEEKLKQLRFEETGMQSKIVELEQACREAEARLTELSQLREIKAQEMSLRDDEARLREVNDKLISLKGSKLQGVEDLLGPDATSASLSQLREMVREKIRGLEKMQAQQEGNTETLLEDVHQLKKELSSDKYQAVEKRYRFAFVQVQTTKMTIKDIDKYYSALEKAVQSYHQEKIALINRIIADLWRQTYRGSDIDAVEICSETEGGTAGATGRRSYNYRVVMKRGSSEIDMRGRCSAGQKVLASIIIRLALSEVFCYDCGILALDEPTTNLDEDNARSLAEALRVLIESRRSVRHFQLIVITHDEQFVRSLGGQALERFYFVHKDREGAFSVIEERTFDQLFA